MDESRSEVRISQRKIVVRDLAALGSPLSSFYPPSSRSHFAFFSSRRQARYLPSPLSLSYFSPQFRCYILISLLVFYFLSHDSPSIVIAILDIFIPQYLSLAPSFFLFFFLLLELTTRSNKNIHFDLGFVIYRWT